MTDMDRARELIEKYLDEVIDKVELAELELLIVSDPEVAKEFARCARTDGFVYFHFNEATAQNALQLEREPERALIEMPKPSPRPWGLLERLVGPTGSVLIHVAVIALLIFLVSYEPPPKPEDPMIITMVNPNDTPPLDDLPKLPDDTTFAPGAEPVLPSETSLAATEEPPAESYNPEPEIELPGVEIESDVKGVLLLPAGMGNRTGLAREEALRDRSGGMGKATEASVVKALDWLKANQLADGSWGPNKVAMTGLSLLTFLAHGEITSSKEYGWTVERSIRFLLSKQREDGTFTGVDTQAGPYEHGIATYAMCEAYGLTRIPSLKPAMEKAVQVILNGQQKGGGWDYRYGKGGRRDTSVAGWQIQALKAALIAGAENSGIKEALDLAAEDLKRARDPETGKFHYTDATSQTSDSMTGVATLCLELIGQGDSREARQGLAALNKALCKWEGAPDWAMYGWYYVTQAKFHEGGADWKRWNGQFARAYVKAQNRDGSWTAPREDEQKYGPAYGTALAALTLQVYYRFLPTYQAVAVDRAVASLATEDVAVVVQ